MTKLTLAEIQADHKHWLRELERWQYYTRAWASEQESIAKQLRQFEEHLERYNLDLREHAAALNAHQSEILDCERAMFEAPRTGSAPESLVEGHRQSAEHHADQLKRHERLRQTYHTIMAQLAVLGHAVAQTD